MSQLAEKRTGYGLADQVRQHAKTSFITAATQLTVRQQLVRATANTEYGDWTLTLPAVSDAAGLTFSIVATIANAKTITVTDAGDDVNFGDLTLDTDDDGAVLWSDGMRWWEISNDIA